MIKHEHNAVVLYDENSEVLGQMEYSESTNIVIIASTYVSDKMRGQGVGRKLIEEATLLARKNKKKIMPLCP